MRFARLLMCEVVGWIDVGNYYRASVRPIVVVKICSFELVVLCEGLYLDRWPGFYPNFFSYGVEVGWLQLLG